MYLFSRRRMVNPAKARAAMERSVEIANRATQISGIEVRPWAAVLSPEFGTIAWAAIVEHLADLEAGFDKLQSETSFGDLVEESAQFFSGGASDQLMQLVSAPPEGEPPNYVATVRSECVNGKISEAMAAGVEIAETASRITGLSTVFAAAATGPYAGVGWYTGFADMAEMESSNQKLLGDSDWIALVDRVSPLFTPHTATTVYRRLG